MYLRAELAAQDMIEHDFTVVRGHDRQDLLCRIGLLASVQNFRRLLVRLSLQVNDDDPGLMSEVGGAECKNRKYLMRYLHLEDRQELRNRWLARQSTHSSSLIFS